MYLSQILYDIFCISHNARKWYLKKLYPFITPTIARVKMDDGTRLKLAPIYDYVQREIYLYKGRYIYESHIVQWLRNFLKPGMNVMDIGAHVGYYLGPICQSINPSGTCLFIEPYPEHYALLQENAQNSGYKDAILINASVSDTIGSATLFPAKDSGRNSLVRNPVTNEKPINVQATTIDDLCTKYDLQKIDLLQIDIEGAETLALQGAKKCLQTKTIRTILCEWHPKQMQIYFNVNPREFLESILDYGYEISCIDSVSKLPIGFNFKRVLEYQHLLFHIKNV